MDIDQAAELLRDRHDRLMASLTPDQLQAVEDLIVANTQSVFTTTTVERRLQRLHRKRAQELLAARTNKS